MLDYSLFLFTEIYKVNSCYTLNPLSYSLPYSSVSPQQQNLVSPLQQYLVETETRWYFLFCLTAGFTDEAIVLAG